jgi:molybdopterin molybdotransferase
MPKTTVDEHAALIRSLVAPALATETVPLAEALGRVTVDDVLSPVDLPLFRNSQMDGFAVISADLVSLPVTLPIVGVIAARPAEPPRLEPGTAVRIMTGAVVPEGADAVVPVEDTSVTDSGVSITQPRTPGEFVRERGSDLHAGDRLLPGGLLLASRHLAVLAAAGLSTVVVRSRSRVAIITTGAELIAPGAEPGLGQIHDANAVALVAAVHAAGATVAFAARVSDDAAAMKSALDAAVATADLVVTSGGISMGDFEVVREVLEPLGAAVTTIAMQPGGPQATAVVDGVPVICFPGNPVSTQISFELFLAPILRERAGLPAAVHQTRVLTTDLRSVPGKRQFQRGRLVGSDDVDVVGGASSHLVAGLAASDLLIDIPTEVTALSKGDTVQTILL